MFSVIIPTKNEEKSIDTLLQSIRQQTLQPQEIIIADKSTDRTVEIARKYNVVVVEGTDDHKIGKGRNNGARYATSPYLIFIDADCEINDYDFLEKLIKRFIKKNLDIATCYFSPDEKTVRNVLIYTSVNALKTWGSMTKKIIAEGAACMIIKKDVLKDIGGFNEELIVGEDVEIIKRAIKRKKKFEVIPLLIQTSARRWDGRSILAITLGAAGAAYATIYGIKWLKKNSHIFEKMYWGKEWKQMKSSTKETKPPSKTL